MKKTPFIRLNPPSSISSKFLVVIGVLSLAGCGIFAAGYKDQPGPPSHPTTEATMPPLSPAQDYAGEILAYFLQIVAGHLGSEQSRQAWRSTGTDAALDFQSISQVMNRPAARKTDLLVLDYDLLGLVDILSYYNPRFNLFKGQTIFNSVYPSSELIAIRLLMQQKLQQDEKVSFTALQDREALLHADASPPTPADLKSINLSATEFQLVKDVFASDPLFFQYYKHPFIVEAMIRIGFYQKDRLTDKISRSATYQRYRTGSEVQNSRSQSVNIVVLPSFTRKFEFGDTYEKPYIYGFRPSASYLQAIDTLKNEIMARTADLLIASLKDSGRARAMNDQSWMALWDNVYAPLVQFKAFAQRPLTIYPENAERLVKDICPVADLVIIMLGEGMDRAIEGSQNTANFSSAGILYFNMEDIRYYKRNDKVDEMSRSILHRLLSIRIAGNAADGDPQKRSRQPVRDNPHAPNRRAGDRPQLS